MQTTTPVIFLNRYFVFKKIHVRSMTDGMDQQSSSITLVSEVYWYASTTVHWMRISLLIIESKTIWVIIKLAWINFLTSTYIKKKSWNDLATIVSVLTNSASHKLKSFYALNLFRTPRSNFSINSTPLKLNSFVFCKLATKYLFQLTSSHKL